PLGCRPRPPPAHLLDSSPLTPGDHCELPVIVAWSPATDATENTWYAVTSAAAALLQQGRRPCQAASDGFTSGPGHTAPRAS
ncbi:hypothetical protein, partial [Kitasatospora aureofaciens]|uniref:hypothetical protein n=1 Tax=Kitasatospora aureofaciens TaxID=1894 RepID=UPI001E386E17